VSQENVDGSRLLTDAFNRRDVEAVVALRDDEGVWYPAIEASAEGGRTYRGHAEVHQYYKDLAEFAAESHAEFSELYDLGDRVLGVGHLSMKFASGVELDQQAACVWTWRNGKCVESRGYSDPDEALKAVGLEE
jgi:ketosteroid isomerase-like protein